MRRTRTLAVVWWMTEQMLGVAAHRGAVGARRTRADVIKIYICVPLHFVATLLHLRSLSPRDDPKLTNCPERRAKAGRHDMRMR